MRILVVGAVSIVAGVCGCTGRDVLKDSQAPRFRITYDEHGRLGSEREDPVRLDIWFGDASITVGESCKVIVMLTNDTETSVWYPVPCVLMMECAGGFLPNGMHVTPAVRPHRVGGLVCRMEFVDAAPGPGYREIRRAVSTTTMWAELGPGQTASEVLYFDGLRLSSAECRRPVDQAMQPCAAFVSAEYRTEEKNEGTRERSTSLLCRFGRDDEE